MPKRKPAGDKRGGTSPMRIGAPRRAPADSASAPPPAAGLHPPVLVASMAVGPGRSVPPGDAVRLIHDRALALQRAANRPGGPWTEVSSAAHRLAWALDRGVEGLDVYGGIEPSRVLAVGGWPNTGGLGDALRDLRWLVRVRAGMPARRSAAAAASPSPHDIRVDRQPGSGALCLSGDIYAPFTTEESAVLAGAIELLAESLGPAATSAKSANAGPSEELPRSDEPDERGNVASPTDPSAYVPAAKILAKHTPLEWGIGEVKLGRLLADFPNTRVRWTKPVKQRRSVHLADWVAYVARRKGDAGDGWPALAPGELDARTAAARRARG